MYIFVNTHSERVQLCVCEREWIKKLFTIDSEPVGSSDLGQRCQGIQLNSHAVYSMFCIRVYQVCFHCKTPLSAWIVLCTWWYIVLFFNTTNKKVLFMIMAFSHTFYSQFLFRLYLLKLMKSHSCFKDTLFYFCKQT